MPTYNLIEYSNSYLDTLGSLWQFKRDEQNMNNGNPAYVITADSESFKYKSSFLKPVQDGLFLGCSWMRGEQKGPPSLKSVTLILQWWNLAAIIPYLRKKQKIYDPHDTPLEFCIFSLQISKFCYIKKHRYRFYFDIWFLILSNFFESIKIVLGNMVTISMMSVKMATLGLLKIAILK